MPLRPGESFLQGSARVKGQRGVLALQPTFIRPPPPSAKAKVKKADKVVSAWEKLTPIEKVQKVGFARVKEADDSAIRYRYLREADRTAEARSYTGRIEAKDPALVARDRQRAQVAAEISRKLRSVPKTQRDFTRRQLELAAQLADPTQARTRDVLGPIASAAGGDIAHYMLSRGLRPTTPRARNAVVSPAGLLPIGFAQDIQSSIQNMLLGGAAGVVGLRSPTNAGRDITENVSGMAQLASLLATPYSPQATGVQAKKLYQQARHGYLQQYGPDVSGRQVWQKSEQRPLSSILTAASVVAPALKAGSFITAFSELGDAAGLASRISTAWRATKFPTTPRTLMLRGGEDAMGAPVHIPHARSPMIRVGQRAYDVGTRRISPEAKVIGRISESARAARALGKQQSRAIRRIQAEAYNAFKQAGKTKEAEHLRAFYMRGKPEGMSEDDWLNALKAETEAMLHGREMILPGKFDPKLARLQRRVAVFQRRYDRVKANLQETKIPGRKLQPLLDERRSVQGQLRMARERGTPTAALEARLHNLDQQIAAGTGELVDPVEHSPAREQMHDAFTQAMGQDEADHLIQVSDLLARGAEPDNPTLWYRRVAARFAEDPEAAGIDLSNALLQEAKRQTERILSTEEFRKTAFDGVDMSVFREHNIDDFLEKIPEYLQRGAPYRFWYENSGREILDFANGDKDFAARVAQVVAVMSASRNPRENINLALEAVLQWQAGKKIDVATGPQNRKAQSIMDGGNWEGRKTDRFYANMLEDIDPERYQREFPGGEVTNDIWMARLFGLKTDTPTPREYEAMAKIQQNIAAATGWKPKQIQAALWVPAKADAGRMITGPGGKKIRAPLTDDEAGIDFARALQEESVTMAVEAAPGRRAPGQEYLRSYDELPWEEKRAYTHEKAEAAQQFLADAEILGRVETEGLGIFENATNPNFTITIPTPVERLGTGRISKKTGEEIKTPVSWTTPTARRHLTQVMSIIGDALNQDAMAWFRPILRRDKPTAQNGALLKLSRPLTDDETFQLYNELRRQLGGEVPVVPGPDGDLYALNFSGKKNVVFHQALDDAIDVIHQAGDDLEADPLLFRFDGDYRTRSRYTQAARTGDFPPRRAGRPDVREAARRLRERSQEIDSRYLGSAERAAPAAPGVEPPLLQSVYPITGGAPVVKGAVELLGNRRFRMTLFRGSDATTAIHELGHIALYDLHPDDLAVVERDIAGGRSLKAGEWTTDNHERFARSFEQFFRSGYSANTSLRGAFMQIMRWMREVWATVKDSGEPITPEVRAVFERSLGRANTAETDIARIHSDPALSHWGVLVSNAKTELEAHEARVELAKQRGTIEAMRQRVEQLETERREAEAAGNRDLFDQKTAQRDEVLRALNDRDQLNAMRANKRTKMLGARLAELEKALRKPDASRYEGAVASADWLQGGREEILRDVFGDKYDMLFGNRESQMARWLADRGVIAPGHGPGQGMFPFRRRGSPTVNQMRQAAATPSRKFGRTRTEDLNLHTRNEMILWQQGDYRSDIGVLYEQYLRAASFKYVHDLRTQLHEVGEPIPVEGPNKGWYIVDPEGTPLPREWSSEHTPEMIDAELQTVLDALAADDEQLSLSIRHFVENSIHENTAKARRSDGGFGTARQVHPRIVHSLLIPYTGSRMWNPVNRVFNIANSLTRIALIYTNPGYIPSNVMANFLMLLADRGVLALPDLYEGARLVFKDRVLGNRVRAETGETFTTSRLGTQGATSAVSVAENVAREAEHKAASAVSIFADDWMRAAAWSGVARRHGYRGRAGQLRLLDGKTEKARRDRELVGQEATQAMIDFGRLSPWEQKYLRPIVFVWPFLRGAAAWPIDYVKAHPVAAGAFTATSGGMAQQAREQLGPTPAYYKSLVPFSIDGRVGEVANLQSVNPLGPIGDFTETAMQLADINHPMSPFANLAGYLSPPIQSVFQEATQQGTFGQAQSTTDLFKKGVLPSLVPGLGFWQDWHDPTKPAVQMDQDFLSTLSRRTFRFTPQQMNLAVLNENAKIGGAAKTLTEKMHAYRVEARAAWNQLMPGEHMPRVIEQSIQDFYTVSQLRKQLQDEIKTHQRGSWQPTRRDPKLTPLQETAILFDVLSARYPAAAEGLPDPREIYDQYGEEAVVTYGRNLSNTLFKGKRAADKARNKAKLVKKAA